MSRSLPLLPLPPLPTLLPAHFLKYFKYHSSPKYPGFHSVELKCHRPKCRSVLRLEEFLVSLGTVCHLNIAKASHKE